MRKQSGFTLIELMVVMAIIAILATAGLSAYGGYIKKARDATRLEDIRALETVAIASFNAAGQSVSHSEFEAAVLAMNNNTLLTDPLDTKGVCLGSNSAFSDSQCYYYYSQCDNGGYVLQVRFESVSNHLLYSQDKLNTDTSLVTPDTYDV